MSASGKRINIDNPRYDQSTFEGRAKHFFATTNPLNVLASDVELEKAKEIVTSYRAGKEDKSLTEDQIWKAKELYDSAYHPQTGEKVFILGSFISTYLYIHKKRLLTYYYIVVHLKYIHQYRSHVISSTW